MCFSSEQLALKELYIGCDKCTTAFDVRNDTKETTKNCFNNFILFSFEWSSLEIIVMFFNHVVFATEKNKPHFSTYFLAVLENRD